VDEAVEQIRNNRYSSVIEHLGGNVYLTVDNNDKTDCCVDIRYRWCSPIDHKMYPTPSNTICDISSVLSIILRFVL
jgi:calcineurin-like phosphoesterase family protein